MKIQGLTTTIRELKLIIDELEGQIEFDNLNDIPTKKNSKFQLNIINKSGLSDTWEFEKSHTP